MNQSIEVPASHAGVLRMIACADEVEQHEQLSFEHSYMLRLVIEEIGTNIVKYGYHQDARGVIQLQYTNGDGLLRVVIRDHGHPFDPRASRPECECRHCDSTDRRAWPLSSTRIDRRAPVSSQPRQRLE
jgi:anti-sigma regulatory factor (Ser/Thr protein kinase)